jgi:hypothetical protein
MASLKSYFSSRIGKPAAWSFTPGGTRFGEVFRRDYAIEVKAVDAEWLTAAVTSVDYDKAGRKVSRVPADHGVVKVGIKDAGSPLSVLEDVAREADKKTFANRPKTVQADAPGADDGIEGRLKALGSPGGHGDDPPPRPESAARVRRFWSDNPGLALPTLYSSKDGAVRACWQSGADRTLWINFPADGPLGWSVSVPRQGGYGLRKMNARCPDDQDIIPLAELLGVRCHR